MIADDNLRDALKQAFRDTGMIIGPEDAEPEDEDLGILADAALKVIKDWTAFDDAFSRSSGK